MKELGCHDEVNTNHLLDTLDSELLDLQGDLVALGCEEVGEVQDLLWEGGGEENHLSSLGHLLLDALALVAHALQVWGKVSFKS
jgi:hypothetical protein